MSVGISLLLHQDFARAAKLTEALLRDGCKIAVHIDGKIADKEFAQYRKRFSDQPNLRFTRRVSCEWGAFSLVRAQLIASQEILDRFKGVSHVVQLSGSCLPSRPVADLARFLAQNRGTDFIESVRAGHSNWIKGGLEEERFTLYFPFSWKRQRWLFDAFVTLQRKIGINRKMPKGLEAHIGSQWWVLSRETLSAILKDPNRPQYDKFFSRCWIADESYFQTLVRKHAKRIESRSLTFSRFDMQGNPMLFYDDHLEYLEHLNSFFVRKVWHGANLLYETLLDPDRSVGTRDAEMRLAFAAQIEKLEGRRNKARAGLMMQSRWIKDLKNTTETAAPYSVLIGFNKTYLNFSDWLHQQTQISIHGELFAKNKVNFANDATASTGNLADNARIRDYAPREFLRNLIWNNRKSDIVFQFWSPRKSDMFKFIAQDSNATIHFVRYAWILELMQENITNINVLREKVTASMMLDQRRLTVLKNGKAKVRVYSLADALGDPAKVLYKLIEHLQPKAAFVPRELPEHLNNKGLENFVTLLNNNGMNIDLELAKNDQPDWHDKDIKPVLIAE